MAAPEEEVRRADDAPALPTVAEPTDIPRRRHWQPKPRNVLALDRHIAHVYGDEWVARSRR